MWRGQVDRAHVLLLHVMMSLSTVDSESCNMSLEHRSHFLDHTQSVVYLGCPSGGGWIIEYV